METGPLSDWVAKTEESGAALAANAPQMFSIARNQNTSTPRAFGGISSIADIKETQYKPLPKSGSNSIPWVLPSTFGATNAPKVTYNTSLAKRQIAMFPGTYEELGFNIYRDNEEYYNENTSAWNDAYRALTQLPTAFGYGFTAGVRGTSNLLNIGRPAEMINESSPVFDEASEIALSTRGGISQSLVNIPYNVFGYTAGIAAELLIEDLALTALIPGSAGSSMMAIGARTVQGTGKILKGFIQSGKFLAQLKGAAAARAAYTTGKFALESGAKAFIPATVQGFKNSPTLLKAITSAPTYVHFYRDIRMAGLALDESRMEAFSATRELENQLVGEFQAANGRLPNTEEATAIRDQALNKLGTTTYWANLPVIYATNKLIFPTLFTGKNVLKAGLTQFKNDAGKLALNLTGTKVSAEIVKGTGFRSGIKNAFSTAKNAGLKQTAFSKIAGFSNYFSANITEGLQEVYQEGLSKGLTEYYKNTYYNPQLASAGSGVSYALKGMGEQFTTQEGWEAFLGGFLGAGLLNTSANVLQRTTNKIYSKVDPEGFQQKLDNDLQTLERMKTYIDEVGQDVTKLLAPELQNLVLQSRAQSAFVKASELNDTKAIEDIKDQAIFNHFAFLINSNRLNLFTEALQNHKTELTEEEKMQMFGTENGAEADMMIDNILARAKSVEDRYKKAMKEYGPAPYSLADLQEGTPEYNKQLVKRYAYDQAVRDYVFGLHAWDQTASRLDQIYDSAITDPAIAGATNNLFAPLFNSDRQNLGEKRGSLGSLESTITQQRNSERAVDDQIKMLEEQIAVTEDAATKDNLSQTLAQKKDELRKSKELTDLLDNYKRALDAYLEVGEDTVVDPETGQVSLTFTDAANKAQEELFNALEAYLKRIASDKAQPLEKKKTVKLFEQIRDYYAVGADNIRYRASVSILSDPNNLEALANAHEAAVTDMLDGLREQTKSLINNIFVDQDLSALLESLSDIGVYPNDPEEIRAFIFDRVRPTSFSSDQDADAAGNLIEGSPTWQQVQDILDNFDFVSAQVEEAVNEIESEATPTEPTASEEAEPTAAAQPQEELQIDVDVQPEAQPEAAPKPRRQAAKYQWADLESEYGPSLISALKAEYQNYRAAIGNNRPASEFEWLNQSSAAAQIIERAKVSRTVENNKREKEFKRVKSKLEKAKSPEEFDLAMFEYDSLPFEDQQRLDVGEIKQNLENKWIKEGKKAGKTVTEEENTQAAAVNDRNDNKKMEKALDNILNGEGVDSALNTSDDDIIDGLMC